MNDIVWGVFEVEDAIHILPCVLKDEVYEGILWPHIKSYTCQCRPEMDLLADKGDKQIWCHNIIQ